MNDMFSRCAAGWVLVLTMGAVRADFETWKNKDGKSAELEITGVDEGAAGTQVRFLAKGGSEVTLKLEDLAADDQGRVKEWQKLPPLSASFARVKMRQDANDPSVQFVFDLKGGIALPSQPVKMSNIKATVGGKELVVKQWTCIVDDGRYDEDASTKGGVNARRKWSLVITAEGDFNGLEVEDCEFSADVEVICGKSPKEVSAMFPLPKGEGPEENVEKILEPLSVTVGTLHGADFRRPARRERRDGTTPEVVTGYSLAAGKKAKGEDGNDRWEDGPIFRRAFVVRGKEHPEMIDKSKATDPIKVVVKYWSESYGEKLLLTKAASNRGRGASPDGAGKGGR